MLLVKEKLSKKGCYSVGYCPTFNIYVMCCFVEGSVTYKRYYQISEEDYTAFDLDKLDSLAELFSRVGVFTDRFIYSQRASENINS